MKILVVVGIQGIANMVKRHLEYNGIDAEVIGGDFLQSEMYSSSPTVCDYVKKQTGAREFDWILIANNLGAGVEKAAAVSPAMRDRTIVFWTGVFSVNEKPYSQLGIKHFTLTHKLADYLLEQINTARVHESVS